MKTILPILLLILVVTSAIVFTLAKNNAPKLIANRIGIPATQLDEYAGFKDITEDVTPTPSTTIYPTATVTPAYPSTTPTPTAKATPFPEVFETNLTPTPTITQLTTSVTKVCTPVYGMADTCTEHIVVDTGASDSILFNLAGLSYLSGLLAFIKAKRA